MAQHDSPEELTMAGNPNPGGTREPVLTSAGLTAAIMSVVNVLVVLNIVTLDAQQLGAINIAVGSILGIVLAVWARGKVTPV